MMKKRLSILLLAVLLFSLALPITALADTPIISVDLPLAKSVASGDTVVFTVAASGENLTYSWHCNGQELSETGANMSIVADQSMSGNQYFCVVYSGQDSAISTICTLTVTEAEATAAPTATPTAAPVIPTVTKPPYGETVTAGASAVFVAHANDWTSCAWRFTTPNYATSYDYNKISTQFPSLVVTGGDTETLVLDRIPIEMNGWHVACLFKGPGGDSITDSATIEVVEMSSDITITTQPKDVTAEVDGADVVLEVEATCTDAKIGYQWYSGTTESVTAMRAIEGAVNANYVPTPVVGTKYYCCCLTNQTNNASTYSDVVKVTFQEEAHEHSYSDAWTYNDISHWHQCICGGHSDEAFHSYEWEVTKQPTDTEDGEQTGTCTICGFENVQSIPAGSETTTTGRSGTMMIIGLVMVVIAIIAVAALLILKVLKKEEK